MTLTVNSLDDLFWREANSLSADFDFFSLNLLLDSASVVVKGKAVTGSDPRRTRVLASPLLRNATGVDRASVVGGPEVDLVSLPVAVVALLGPSTGNVNGVRYGVADRESSSLGCCWKMSFSGIQSVT